MAAVHRDALIDKGITVFVFLGFAVPTFWLALLLMYLFGVKLNWLPVSGLHSLGSENYGTVSYLWDMARHLIMPVMVASFGSLAGLSRYMRSSMLNVINQDYITTAGPRGVPKGLSSINMPYAMHCYR
jgi:peptide/nickel transport system permease protein